MNIAEVSASSSLEYYEPPFPNSWDELTERIKAVSFRIASYLTDPICMVHEYFRRIQVVESLHPTLKKVEIFARKLFLIAALVGFALLAIPMTLPGLALRSLASHVQKEPYIHFKGKSAPLVLPKGDSFTLLSWNICCPAGGYSITDGGVIPWRERIDRLAAKIGETDADVNCFYETFDTESALYLHEKLQEKGYCSFYFDIAPQGLGVSSGIFVASKYKIQNPEFTPFPQDTLVGRTKYAAKGVFAFDLESCGTRIFSTHLQHSEEPEFPTDEEIEARRRQMEIVLAKVNQVKDRCIVITGDLNLDDKEYNASSWAKRFKKGDDFGEAKTWGGDAFCVKLVGKRASGPLNLDHTMMEGGTSIRTTLVRTGYNSAVYSEAALSDHEGLLSCIVPERPDPAYEPLISEHHRAFYHHYRRRGL